MQKVCRNCCKIFCKQRDTVTECNKQITFVRQMIENIDKFEVIGNIYENKELLSEVENWK